MIRLQQEVTELRSAVDVKLKELEVKVRDGASVQSVPNSRWVFSLSQQYA